MKDKVLNKKAIIVGFIHNRSKTNISLEDSMTELKELTIAAGGKVVSSITQSKSVIDVRFYIGKGKVEEIKEKIIETSADIVIFNDELSGAQIRNLSEELDIEVIDRTALILEIFSTRATTKEGKLQVELANLKYNLPRLLGKGKEMSKIGGSGGGANNKGSGEQKLELDRRKIHDRIAEIRKELEEVKKNRSVQRKQRNKSNIPVVALVGYTNSGKSSMMNYFIDKFSDEDKKVFEKDMLFATLSTSNRRINYDNKSFVLTDTVGFVSKLPHNLVDAFKATLEEVVEADFLIHLVDISNEKHQMQMDVTNKVLEELGVKDTKSIYVFNKIDKVENYHKDYDALYVSVKEDINMNKVLDAIMENVFDSYQKVEMLIPYQDAKILSYLKGSSKIISEEYEEAGTKICIEVSEEDYNRYKDYIVI